MKLHRLWILPIALTIALLFGPGCGGKAPANLPTPVQLGELQRIGARIADGVTASLQIADDAGELVDTLPLSTALKDKYDCAILRVTGADNPSATVQTVCGPLPKIAAAPLTLARTKLEQVTSCTGLRAIAAQALDALSPLIVQLGTSDQPALKLVSQALTATLTYTRGWLLQGGVCGQMTQGLRLKAQDSGGFHV